MNWQINYLEYHKSIAREINAAKDRVRQLIGNRHWLTDGEHKEAVLRKVLRGYLPESVRVGRGFVCFEQDTSNQIDVLITAHEKPTLFKDGELVFVTPDSVQAIVEVKTVQNSRTELRETLLKLSTNISKIRSNHNFGCLAGLFVYDDTTNQDRITDKDILEVLQSVTNDERYRVVNWVAFGPNRFFRYWDQGSDVGSLCEREVWHSYELTEGLSHAYFLSNMTWEISHEFGPERGTISNRLQYAWFPVEGGKERFRRWCISKSGGQAIQFTNNA